MCESRPTSAARSHSLEVEVSDGTAVVIRLLLRGDRTELQQAYEHLSEASKQLRFFLPPKHLSKAHLAYLTDLDYDQRFALAAYERDDPSHRGLGVARWVRDHDEPSRAEAAVVVIDEMQGRGIGTVLLRSLVREAVAHGITTFTADIRWDNRKLLEKLTGLGAAIRPAEPGVADVELRLPITDDELGGPALHHLFLTAAGHA